jgi:DNA-binding NarL/FixJ family response regulator
MSAQPVRVVVAEDEVLVREGIQRLFEGMESVAVLDAVGDVTALWAAVARYRPEVVVTDIRLPPSFTDEGIRFAQELRQHDPDAAVVVLSQHAEPVYATTLFEGGAARRAYLLKQRVADGATLAETVRTVAAGGSYVDVHVVEKLLRASEARRTARFDNLTPRDREILRLMAEGRSNTSIARELGVTSRAVERHVSSIFTKLGIDDSPDYSRRVLAVLSYLSGRDDGSPVH